jgi:hypothetical protein
MKWNKRVKQSFYYSKKVKITHILNLMKLEKNFTESEFLSWLIVIGYLPTRKNSPMP